MQGIETFAKEYVKITSYLMDKEKGQLIKDGAYYAVERPVLEKLLDQNPYVDTCAKLTVWKRLRWIYTDNGRITKKIYIQQADNRKRVIVIDLGVYQQLRELMATKPE